MQFTGAEHDASSLFARMVDALRETFVTEDSALPALFALDDATVTVRVEANMLLYSTLEVLVDPVSPAADWMDSSGIASPRDGKRVLLVFARRLSSTFSPFRGTFELLSVRIERDTDPHEKITVFNNALADVRCRSTVDDEEVKDQFISALDSDYYSPVVSRLLLHDQRAANDLLTIQQWVRECHAAHVQRKNSAPPSCAALAERKFGDPPRGDFGGGDSAMEDLVELVLELKRQVKHLTDKNNDKSSPGHVCRSDSRCTLVQRECAVLIILITQLRKNVHKIYRDNTARARGACRA
ncbi:hypothetical protein CYMTET_34115 [Cymbomonas tetramitiformis]|uniref:Uncharacterized protein n=1 Tax=Cymbomonas tetramitiformis TaxID=36881 RepID=A0AAE0FBU6_9CHLO|nr:hypothetical protein CYMTET_34115 [Cymbomonas tetramitiformis]